MANIEREGEREYRKQIEKMCYYKSDTDTHRRTHTVYTFKKCQMNREKCDAKTKMNQSSIFCFFFFFGSETQIFMNVEMVSQQRDLHKTHSVNPKKNNMKREEKTCTRKKTKTIGLNRLCLAVVLI